VKVYDDVLSASLCKSIIQKFESHPKQQVTTYLEDHRSFTEININQNIVSWKKEFDTLFGTMQKYLVQYKNDVGVDDRSWPEQMGYEQLRMKRYLPNGKDDFKFHVDVQDHASARRFLVYFWYLNDVAEGGETAFQLNRNVEPKLKVQPKAGRLLMFPSLWTHPHIGVMPISNTKYIIGGYLHYI
jgi:prolyl 4-hydroxylase